MDYAVDNNLIIEDVKEVKKSVIGKRIRGYASKFNHYVRENDKTSEGRKKDEN